MGTKAQTSSIDEILNLSEHIAGDLPTIHPVARAKQMLFNPRQAWEDIAKEGGGLKDVFIPYTFYIGIVPLLIRATLRSLVWGTLLGLLGGDVTEISMGASLFSAAILYVQWIVGLLILSKVTELAASSFSLKKSWVLSTRVFVYGFTPGLLATALGPIPFIGILASLGGYIWSFLLVAGGIKRVLKSEGTNLPASPTKDDNIKKALVAAVVALLVFHLVPFGEAKTLEGPKKRIAVSKFKDKSNHSHHYWPDVGDGMTEMLTTALQKTGKFIMVERESLPSALEEQFLAKDGKVQAATGAKSGQLIGAGYIVTGAVTEFGIKESKLAAGRLGRLLPFGGDASLESQTARVALDLRFFDTTTGQLIATEKAEGAVTSRKVSGDLDILPSIEFGKDGFDDTVIGKATREAIEKAVALVEKNMEKTTWHGRIVKVEDGKIFLNTGTEDGCNAGDTFEVSRAGEAMVDPETGESLGAENTRLGQVRIVAVLGKRLSRAEPVGTMDAQAGDIVQ